MKLLLFQQKCFLAKFIAFKLFNFFFKVVLEQTPIRFKRRRSYTQRILDLLRSIPTFMLFYEITPIPLPFPGRYKIEVY